MMTDADVPTASSLAPARRRLCVALLVALGFALGCSEFIVIGIEPEIASALDVSLARAGELISFFAVAYALLTPVLALTTGRFRRYTLLVAYCAIFCAGNLVATLAGSFGVLLASRLVIGSVSGALLAVGVTYLPELLGEARLSMGISVVYGAFSVAMVLATSVGKLITDAWGWHAAMVVTLVMCVVVCVALVAFLPRSGATDEPATAREQFVLLRQPQVIAGILIFLFGIGSVYVFYGYVSPYLEEVLGLSVVATSGVLMVYGCVCFFSNLLSGWVDARFGVRGLPVVFALQGLALLALYLAGSRVTAALAAVFAIALVMYVVSVSCISMFMRTARTTCPKALTLASSLEPMSFNVGIAFGTAVGGVVVEGPGLACVGLVGAALSCVALAICLLTIRLDARARGKAA